MHNIIKPTFAQIGSFRKGEPKTSNAPGKDLVDRFRAVFGEGYQAAEADFMETYKTMKPKKINAILPPFPIKEVFDDYYEAYLGKRLMARATPEGKYLFFRQSETNDITINVPEEETTHDMKISDLSCLNWYQGKDGKFKPLEARRTGRLHVVIPELKRMAIMTIHTTSVYDVANINNQLAGYQQLAESLGGSISGIPFVISRKKKLIHFRNQWGRHAKKETGMIDIAIDDRFSARMFKLIESQALPGITQPLQLTDQESAAALIEDGIVNGEYQEVSREMETPERPYQPGVLKTKLSMAADGMNGQHAGQDQRQKIGQVIGQHAGRIKGQVLKYLTNRSNILEVPGAMVKALDQWLQEDIAIQELKLVAERYS